MKFGSDAKYCESGAGAELVNRLSRRLVRSVVATAALLCVAPAACSESSTRPDRNPSDEDAPLVLTFTLVDSILTEDELDRVRAIARIENRADTTSCPLNRRAMAMGPEVFVDLLSDSRRSLTWLPHNPPPDGIEPPRIVTLEPGQVFEFPVSFSRSDLSDDPIPGTYQMRVRYVVVPEGTHTPERCGPRVLRSDELPIRIR